MRVPALRTFQAVALGAAMGLLPVVAAGPASAAVPFAGASAQSGGAFCSVVFWGSLQKVRTTAGPLSSLDNVRAGRHACYDRLVVDISGGSTGGVAYDVSYVDTVYTEGKGDVVPLAGGAFLQIVVHAPSYDIETGNSTFDESGLPAVGGFTTFRQVGWGSSFEGQTTIGLGVRARLPMRVFTLSGPGNMQRLVIDVAHRWTAF